MLPTTDPFFCSQIESLSEALEAVCDEVKRTTNFNTFVLTGGPTPMGEGGFQLLQYVIQPTSPFLRSHPPPSVGSGEANLTGQTFQQFLGPWWDVLKAKYGEWLCLSYSKSPSRICVLVHRLITKFRSRRDSSSRRFHQWRTPCFLYHPHPVSKLRTYPPASTRSSNSTG